MIAPARSGDPARAAQEAARWFARMRAGPGSKAERLALQNWLDQHASHREAYLKVIDLWSETGRMRANAEVLAMREAALRRYASRRRFSTARPLAVGVASIALTASAIWLLRTTTAPPTQAFQTGVCQTATVALADGSQLTLDTDTAVHTRIGLRRRDVFLDRGRAFFKVAKDHSRPFVVTAQGKSVTATGTAFEVTAEPRRFEVFLVEGHVRVSQPTDRRQGGRSDQMTADLDPGTRLIGSGDGRWILAKDSSGVDLAWMQGELVFDNKRLGDIVADMNRYSRRKILIEDPRVAARTIYGAFMAGDVDQFAHALVDYNIAKIQSETESTVVMTAP